MGSDSSTQSRDPARAGGSERQASDELIGELAHELSLLIRSDVELSALERGPVLRKVTVELAVAVLAGFVFLLALAAIGWSAVLSLANVVPRAVAALLVAAGWAAAVLRPTKPVEQVQRNRSAALITSLSDRLDHARARRG